MYSFHGSTLFETIYRSLTELLAEQAAFFHVQIYITLSYRLSSTIILNLLQMLIRTIQDKSKLDTLLYQKQFKIKR